MTNDFFDSKRFFCYLSKLWTEQRRTLLISAAILLGILFVIELWSCVTSYSSVYYPDDGSKASDSAKNVISIWGTLLLYAGSCISATRFFTDGQQKAGRIHVLTLPVSMFENWLARTLLFVVSYLVVFHIIFYGLEIVRFLLFAPALPKVDIEIASPIIWIVRASDMRINILITTAWTVFAISFFMLGSLVFPRKPLLGTTISAFILVLIGGLLSLFFAMPGEYSFYFVSAWIGILGVMNLWLSYRRLCELEVIDRM
jgi:hypothetical protein